MTLVAFHNDPKIKRKYLSRVKAHYKADEIIKGTYWQNGKGCAVGCTIHSGNHKRYEDELGLPEGLARLEDTIFENLENGTAKEWPVKFLSTIKVGADLEIVGCALSPSSFFAFLLAFEISVILSLIKFFRFIRHRFFSPLYSVFQSFKHISYRLNVASLWEIRIAPPVDFVQSCWMSGFKSCQFILEILQHIPHVLPFIVINRMFHLSLGIFGNSYACGSLFFSVGVRSDLRFPLDSI